MSKRGGFTMIENDGALTGGRLRNLNGSELSVWITLKRFYNVEKGYAFVSVPRIARETGFPTRTVERALKGLDRKGWARTIRPGGGKRASHRIPTIPDALPPTNATGVDGSPTPTTGEPRPERRGSTDSGGGGAPTETTGQVPTPATGVQDYSQEQKQHHPHNTSGSAEAVEAEGDFFSELVKTEPVNWDRIERALRDHSGLTRWKHAIELAKGHGWEPIDLADLIEDGELAGNPGLLYRRIEAGTRSKPGPTRKKLDAAAWFAENAEQGYRDRAHRIDNDLDRMVGHLARSLPIDEARQAAAFVLATFDTGEPPTLAELLTKAGEWLRMNGAKPDYLLDGVKRDRQRAAREKYSVRYRSREERLIEQAESHLINLTLTWPERTGPQSPRETRESTETGTDPAEAQNTADGQDGDAERLDTIKAELTAEADRRINQARNLLDLAARTLIEDGLDESQARNTAATLYGLGFKPIDGEAQDDTRERVREFKRDELTGRWLINDSIERHRKETRQRVWDQVREDHLVNFPPTRDELLSGRSWATIDGLADYATEQARRVLNAGREWFREWAATQPKPEPQESSKGSPKGSDLIEGEGAPDDAQTATAADPKIAAAAAKLDAIREEKRKACGR